MPAACQDPDLAAGGSSGTAAAASRAGQGQGLPSPGDRVLELLGEWPALAGDDDELGSPAALGARDRILADRLAASLMQHEPGWRLPRVSTLARRHRVSVSHVERAIDDLIHRCIIRRLPNGQLYRTSPAEYLLPLEGVSGLASQVDPMGNEVTCHRQISQRGCPEDVGQALAIPSGQPVTVVRMMWTAGGNPAGLTATYLFDPVNSIAESSTWELTPARAISLLLPPAEYVTADARSDSLLRPGALFIEMQPPPPSAARSLRLAPGQCAALIIVRFDDQEQRPAALTVAALRADTFRILIQSPDNPLASRI